MKVSVVTAPGETQVATRRSPRLCSSRSGHAESVAPTRFSSRWAAQPSSPCTNSRYRRRRQGRHDAQL